MPRDLVFIIDDDEAMRDSLSWLLTPLGHDVRCFADPLAFLAALPPSDRAACIVTDVRMPGMSGLELHETLAARGSHIPVIIITGHGDVPMAVRAMRAGALDFIEKPLNNQLLIERINEALRLSHGKVRQRQALGGILSRFQALTGREREVALAVAHGRQNKVIAHDLGISLKTVEIHRANAMAKLEAGTAADLARMLTSAGLLETPRA